MTGLSLLAQTSGRPIPAVAVTLLSKGPQMGVALAPTQPQWRQPLHSVLFYACALMESSASQEAIASDWHTPYSVRSAIPAPRK